MMDMAEVEEAARETYERRGALQVLVSRSSKCDEWNAYYRGFLAGARWRDKQPLSAALHLANGPARMVVWPNADDDRAAEDEG